MIRFVITFLGSFCLLAASVIALNFYVDPGSLFGRSGGSSELKLAKILAMNSNAITNVNLDERIFQKNRIQLTTESISVIVTGSSRSMTISSVVLQDKSLNAAVSGASIEDHVALTIMALEKLKPKTVILGIDPWVFNQNSGQSRWQSIEKEYAYGRQVIGDASYSSKPHQQANEPDRLSQLLNYSYTRAAAMLLAHHLLWEDLVESAPNDNAPTRGILRRSDGSIVYDQKMETLSQEEINKNAKSYAAPPVYSIENYKWSKTSASVFEDLIAYLSRHTTVVILLSPYHPITYSLISEKYSLRQVEDYIRTASLKHHIQVIGSYNPSPSNCLEYEFFDGMHPKDVCMSKLFKGLRRQVATTP